MFGDLRSPVSPFEPECDDLEAYIPERYVLVLYSHRQGENATEKSVKCPASSTSLLPSARRRGLVRFERATQQKHDGKRGARAGDWAFQRHAPPFLFRQLRITSIFLRGVFNRKLNLRETIAFL